MLIALSQIALATMGCGSSSSSLRPVTAPPRSAGSALTSPQIVSSDDDPGGTPAEVFERARRELEAGNPGRARALFDRVAEAERELSAGAPPTPLARAAAYNAALCAERSDAPRDARDRYRALAAAAPESADAVDALLRRSRLDVELEDYVDLRAALPTLLARGELAPGDRAEALALGAITLVDSGDLTGADKEVAGAQRALASAGEVPPPQNAAAVAFAQGELLRARALAIRLLAPADGDRARVLADFPQKMEARCQRILDAEEAYIEAIKTHDVRWAVRSGVRVASLYAALHDDLLEIPAPASATPARQALFRGAMRLRYRILLEKGLGTLEHTLNLESARGIRSVWFEHARRARASLRAQLADERAELAKLPFSEEDLKRAFEELAKK